MGCTPHLCRPCTHPWVWLALGLVVALAACQPSATSEPASTAPRPAATQPKALAGGPIADYELMSGVSVHVQVDEMAPEFRRKLRSLLGHRLFEARWKLKSAEPDDDPTDDDESLRWMRDYQPIYVRDGHGHLVAVRYLAENPNRSAFQAPGHRRSGQTWVPGPRGGHWVRSQILPLIHENGNLVIAGRRLLVSEKLIEDNAYAHGEPHLVRNGYRPRTRTEVIRVLATTLRRKPEDVIVLPPMPYESTEHVDLFLLPLDHRTVMVPRIDQRSLDRVKGQARYVGTDVKDFLDETAKHLEHLGLVVPRWPMLPPEIEFVDPSGEPISEEEAEETGGEFELLVFSPANALLLNVAPGHVGEEAASLAFLPSFVDAFDDLSLVSLAARYTQTWQRELQKRGYQSVLVDSAELVSYLGLLRCVSAPLPAL
jgi:hypothetical protein